MLREYKLTTQLLETLQQGAIKKIIRSTKSKNVELRREVGNNSFFADILISLSAKNSEADIFNTKKTKFIAIEVKISDWKQGLYQAWRYYSFAEKSYLALYEEYAKNIDIELFKGHNVGLIIFGENSVKVLYHPIMNQTISDDSYRLSLRKKIWQRSLLIQGIQPAV